MQHLGNLTEDQTVYFRFATHKTDGTPITLAGTPEVKVYKADSTSTETATGVTLSVDHDGVTGSHNVKIDTSADAFYAANADYSVVLTVGTVDGTTVAGTVLANFSIENRMAKATVVSIAANAITSTAIADAAITAAKTSGLATPTNITAASGVTLAASQPGVTIPTVTTVGTVTTVTNQLAASAIAGAVWSEDLTGYTTAAQAGTILNRVDANVQGIGTAGGAAINTDAFADNSGGAIAGVTSAYTKVGTQTNTFANTSNVNASYHTIAAVANALDWVYQFKCGGGTTPIGLVWVGHQTVNGSQSNISAWKHNPGVWEQIGTISGQATTANVTKTLTLYPRHGGTSAEELGNVYIRLQRTSGSSISINTDQMYVSYAITSRSVGYANGSIWVKENGTAGSEVFVNGTADSPCPWPSAKALSATLGLNRFVITPGTTVTLDAGFAEKVVSGRGYGFAFGGQDISSTFIEGAEGLSGTGTCLAGEAIIMDCHLGAITIGEADFVRCHLMARVDLSQNSVPYRFHDCTGIGPGTIAFGGDSQVAIISQMSGVITVTGMVAGNMLYVDGAGELTLAAGNTGGTVYIAGDIRLTNSGSGQTIVDSSRWGEEQQIASIGGQTLENLDVAVSAIDSRGEAAAAVSGLATESASRQIENYSRQAFINQMLGVHHFNAALGGDFSVNWGTKTPPEGWEIKIYKTNYTYFDNGGLFDPQSDPTTVLLATLSAGGLSFVPGMDAESGVLYIEYPWEEGDPRLTFTLTDSTGPKVIQTSGVSSEGMWMADTLEPLKWATGQWLRLNPTIRATESATGEIERLAGAGALPDGWDNALAKEASLTPLAKEASLAPLAKEASLAGLSLGVPEEITTMFRSVLRAIRNVTLRSK